ncbi:CHAT domain-containing protein [Phormidium sp. LEGE 05292]|uniref:CHAT domain-containing protein n=1 Tax=[Phormidium] sp. LEGE 05292 TaxID=767427 RepID=UPI00187E3ECD|nr:CHAT domain-containing tetratricopeptide repeat protein [Phormidium sp. LEGE 05292]MBE9226614.1 CHAT domain-containing protein [Phormidium sp. LEGE 05292]
MAKQTQTDKISKKSPLLGIGHQSLAVFIGILLLSESVVAAPRQSLLFGWESSQIAQQSAGNGEQKSKAAARRAYRQGLRLYRQGTLESLRQAITKFEEALPLFRAMGEKAWEAVTLLGIGKVYSALGEKQKALEYYNQSLSIMRQVGNKKGEATTLNNIGLVYSALGEKQKALEYYNQSLSIMRQVGNKKGEATTLNNIGGVYSALGEKQRALEFYNQSLPLRREVGDKSGEARTLNNIGLVYSALGEKQKALEYFNQSLSLSRQVGDKAQEARTLDNIRTVYNAAQQPISSEQERSRAAAKRVLQEGLQLFQQGTAESKRQAIAKFEEALSLFRVVSENLGEAATLLVIGRVYDDLGEKQKALDYFNQSLALSRQLKNKALEAVTFNNIGLVYDDLGEKQKALDYFNQSLCLRRQVGDKKGEAVTLNNIGLVYDDLGEKQKALDYFNQSLPLRRQVGDKDGEAVTLNNIGVVYSDLGGKQKALDYFNQSLPLRRQVGDKAGEATTLNNIGVVYSALGEKQKALDYYNQSLPLSQQVGDKAQEATTLSTIGPVYSNLGEKQKALEFYNQSLPLQRQLGDKAGEATTLNNIGAVYSALGEKQKALEFYNQSLLLKRQVRDKQGEAATLHNIGGFYLALRKKQKALDYFNQSLSLSRQVGDKAQEAATLNGIGIVYHLLGKKQKALDFYSQSLPLSRQVGDKAQEALILYSFAVLERDKGNLNQALTNIEFAIKIIEELRLKIGSQQLRASYFATVQDYYEFYINLLMRLHKTNPSQGYDAKALHASERSKARSLLELLTEANANIRQGVDPKLLEQERNLQQQLNAAEQNRVKLLQGQYTDKELDNLKQQIENLITQLQQLEGEIRVKSPQYAALKYPQPLTLPEIQQQVLDDNTILLEYSLGEKRSYLWLVSKTEITSYELPKRADIEAAAQAFYAQLKSSEIGSPEVGMKLSQMVLAPVANQLGNKRLIIVGDGALQSIPFAALPIPVSASSPTPLIVQNEIVTLPSASTIAISRNQLKNRTPAPKTLAVIADPVFNINDERLQKSPSGQSNSTDSTALTRSLIDVGVTLQRLPFTRKEAEAILTLVPENLRTSAFDFAASRVTATNPNLAQYRIVHFATHGLINSINPELSGVVLSLVNDKGIDEDGFLRLNDIFNLNLPAELVVLSACQTGLGKEMKGEGLVGLTRGFMYAGAKDVVVSLWSVQDAGTSELMKKFYHQMLEKGLTPVAAMRAAQLEMIKSEQWKSPYYWAAFVVQGEWN